jgi:hypothetical protein
LNVDTQSQGIIPCGCAFVCASYRPFDAYVCLAEKVILAAVIFSELP